MPSAVLAVTLFLLSADLLFVNVGGIKIKYGYFLIASVWLLKPAQMWEAAKSAVARTPSFVCLPLFPLSVSIVTSANLKSSILWTCWLGFDVFTVITLYCFLKVHQFSTDQIQRSVAGALALITSAGMLQFVSIYGFHHIILQPQNHFNVYRINGISGWPHFLNIFSFLLLPLVVTQEELPSWAKLVLVALMFVLVQSTAKTGWVLFAALGALLFLLNRRVFLKKYLLFLLPVTLAALLIPTPAYEGKGETVRGAEKIAEFAADLDVSRDTTSGTDRLLINKMGLTVWAKHPWFGVGPRAYNTYVFSRFDQELPAANKYDANHQVNAKNENIWIELLSETGALFTLGFVSILVFALWVRRWYFENSPHLGAWMALVLYFLISGQVSQSGLLTMVYAVFGIFFYARDIRVECAGGSTAGLPLGARVGQDSLQRH
ncbi:MAG TPA: O-antigen ligase family protein [Casimicrobiaceae bacterium]|nr:O-antigen ligase family protein [Casimicrobiaceae bacterium]